MAAIAPEYRFGLRIIIAVRPRVVMISLLPAFTLSAFLTSRGIRIWFLLDSFISRAYDDYLEGRGGDDLLQHGRRDEEMLTEAFCRVRSAQGTRSHRC